MNSFDAARAVEADGWARLKPYFEERSGGRIVLTNKGVLAKHLQSIAGDLLLNDLDGAMWAIELKVERKHTGNLFLETWSNRNTSDKGSHAERGVNRGWLDHSRADILAYYFIDKDVLYLIDLFELKRWAFGYRVSDGQGGFCDVAGRIYAFPEKQQGAFRQLNETCGRIVPIDSLSRDLGKNFRVRVELAQLTLFGAAA